jgi:hypothetical protein
MRADDLVAFRLALAARRRRGEPFARAWDAELASLSEPDLRHGYPTADALLAARSAWRRGYEREPRDLPRPRRRQDRRAVR